MSKTDLDHQFTREIDRSPCFAWPLEPRWREFLSNFRILVLKTVARGVTATPAESDLLLASALWYTTILGNLRAVLLQRMRPGSCVFSGRRWAVLKSWSVTIFEDMTIVCRRTGLRSEIGSKGIVTSLGVRPTPNDLSQMGLVSRKPYACLSVAIHCLILGVALWMQRSLPSSKSIDPKLQFLVHMPAHPILMEGRSQRSGKDAGQGGGGAHRPMPASLGRLPRASNLQITPPTTAVVDRDSILMAEPTIVSAEPTLMPLSELKQLGDPFGVAGLLSNGPGGWGGIGSGHGTGIGASDGAGYGVGLGGSLGPQKVGGDVTAPSVVYRVEPEYSEQARRARYQGSVILAAIVKRDGTIEILKVLRGLGLGLDENAISALKLWKFNPGMKGGQAVDVALNIEINFSLR